MSPAKFEQFSRALLTKMGVQFTNKGVQISNDGGIDGYGYHIDMDWKIVVDLSLVLRTGRVETMGSLLLLTLAL